ncbi:AraC family transcriptional regulator [Paenibacillus glycanilyticus]|uniref:AraC family transcriptional regulator n=1 Tax=Paenibacillus glycanilyticus TaxID=126569 RepID=A0ABQ6GPI2_9BACL|nr:AraC family transcriptional regulator [Paenibacillus glycanilyticus]GLX71261.1 AraC family transcriptional regulator [Paenibacillus glycanilyticus]
MQTIHKRFEDSALFPFSLVYKDTKSPESELPDHLHDWYEMVWVYSGKGTFFINHGFYEMKPGDIFLIPGNTVHRAFPDELSPITSSAIFFAPRLIQPLEFGDSQSLLRCFEQARKSKNYKLDTTLEEQAYFSRTIDLMQEEWNNRLPNYRAAIAVRLYDWLIALNRMAVPELEHSSSGSSVEPAWIRAILDYIESNVGAREMSLTDLSARASVTSAHFSRVFKRHTGMNVSEYLLIKKIMLAKEKLMLTNETIGSICLECGFESESYFYKKFKLITGMTPVEYKRSCR